MQFLHDVGSSKFSIYKKKNSTTGADASGKSRSYNFWLTA